MRLQGHKTAAPKRWVWSRDVRSLAEALCGQGLAAACSPRSSTGQGPSGQCLLDMVVRVVLPRWAPPAPGSFWILLKVSCERTLSRGSRTVRFLPGLLRCPEGSEHGAGMQGPAADSVQGLSLVRSCLTWPSSLRCGNHVPCSAVVWAGSLLLPTCRLAFLLHVPRGPCCCALCSGQGLSQDGQRSCTWTLVLSPPALGAGTWGLACWSHPFPGQRAGMVFSSSLPAAGGLG